ncbi:phytase [Pseudomassariella vexata]|uniref:Phytase n=1 Tax=Pseudomassariella vexata TaxID=1141098 RepID=A0A1Y2EHW9_9PEZI|nr:phytase [Pseudomassariella vexata]ORY71027.1 phytase [Pseudomassariella vexata]
MSTKSIISAILALGVVCAAQTTSEAQVPIAARTPGDVESDWTAVFYPADLANSPLLIGNDGGAASGGFRAWSLNPTGNTTTTTEMGHETPGRTKLVTTIYGVGSGANQKDLIVTIAQTDSYFRLYEAGSGNVTQVGEPFALTLGDWSALCAWKSEGSGEQYLYLFGKNQGLQLLMRESNGTVPYELVEVQTFDTPVEASACAVSINAEMVYFTGDDSPVVYGFVAEESTATPAISIVGEAGDDVTGLATYIGAEEDYLLVALKDAVEIYSSSMDILGTMTLTGDDDIEVQGLNVYQGVTRSYPAGALTYAVESATGTGFGLSSLQSAFTALGLETHTAYDPRSQTNTSDSIICDACNQGGFCATDASCSCFAGFNGTSCESFTCHDDCSGHGTCIGANICECESHWGGLYCGFKVVPAAHETEANGGDGDDPAIWIHPVDKAQSKIITTTKSNVGAGLGVFDLNGTLVQTIAAGQPNNVDVIYNFQAGNRTIDLVYAACRENNTLCLFEITSDGILQPISGGSQFTKPDYDVYGSCAYRSRNSGTQYLFVNAKSAEYLQYSLTWSTSTASLQTTLVRNFTGGSGGQVEGCVADEANGWLFLGEEPRALWRYGAEPDSNETEGVIVGEVGDGHMHADVEGVTLVEGPTADTGFILVSTQGVSAYNVYRRAAPHEYVMTFMIEANEVGGVDAVSNTDGITAVGTGLGDRFPAGLVVMHDDANQLAEGGTSDEASFKMVGLGEVLGEELTKEVDGEWDPRALTVVK